MISGMCFILSAVTAVCCYRFPCLDKKRKDKPYTVVSEKETIKV